MDTRQKMAVTHNPKEQHAMNRNHIAAALMATFAATGAFAQTAVESMQQRDINQQQRIEQGLKSGALNTREAARLEKEQAAVDRAQANALKDGKLSAKEAVRIDNMQDKASRDIYKQKHDAQTGNPNSKSSQRMQADVQRNVNQEKRIQQGIQSGELTNKEVAKLDRGQAKVARKEYRAGRDGHVGAGEQARIQNAENRQSARIHNQKHDAQERK
jgi:hypothetical protein